MDLPVDIDFDWLLTIAAITPQRPLFEIAGECDIAFADRPIKLRIPVKVIDDPFKCALDYAAKEKKTCLVVMFKRGYYCMVQSDARWMRALRLYDAITEQKRIERQ